MSIEDDARAVIVSLLRGQVCEHGVFSTSAYNEVVKDPKKIPADIQRVKTQQVKTK